MIIFEKSIKIIEMKLNNIVKYAAIGALIYGAYKLGQRNEKENQMKQNSDDPANDTPEEKNNQSADNVINKIQSGLKDFFKK